MNSHLITQAKVDIINMLLMDLGTSFFEIDEILAGKFIFLFGLCAARENSLFCFHTHRQTDRQNLR